MPLFFQFICNSFRNCSFTTATNSDKVVAPLSILPSTSMRAWCIHDYKKPLVRTEMPMPKMKRDDQVLLRVLSASINPIDIKICEGYGRKLLALQAQMGWNDGTMPDPMRVISALTRQTNSLLSDERFPLVPGRDCSAEVVEIAPRVQGIETGDQVIAVIPPEWQGTLADYVLAPAYALAPKPVSLKHTEAAALPYVACTAWSALVTTARIQPENAQGLRILIHGGAGGVGSIAIQMLKCWGARRMVATCSKEKIGMVEKLGAKAIDYHADDAKVNLIANGPYDVVLDCIDSELATCSQQTLGIWRNCLYITLNSPLLADIDRYGLAIGAATFSAKMMCRNMNGPISKGQLYLPAFFSPSQECLNWVSQAASDGRIKPVIDEIFPFVKLPDAFAKVSQLHGKGKTIIDFGSIQST